MTIVPGQAKFPAKTGQKKLNFAGPVHFKDLEGLTNLTFRYLISFWLE
jgi:hypothetical protein